MDFLDIRKKAKERARARAAELPAPEDDGVRVDRPPRDSPAITEPVLADQDLIDRALAARLEGTPPSGPPRPPEGGTPPSGPPRPPEGDPRFTTWRPGTGTPPRLAPGAESAARSHVAREEDFVVVGSGGSFAPAPPDPERPRDPLEEFLYRPDETAPALPLVAPVDDVEEDEPALLVPEEYLTFLVGPEEYAVAIERVREVIRAPPITEVPRAPSHIIGVVTVRGEVVAVVDPRGRLGLPPVAPAEGQGKIVVVDAEEGSCGLVVERVTGVVRLRPGSIEPCPQGIAGQRSELLAGIGRAGERLFTVLDLGALLKRTPARADGGQR